MTNDFEQPGRSFRFAGEPTIHSLPEVLLRPPEHGATYYYDSLYRLDAVGPNDGTASWGLMWSFDTWGNRLIQTPLGIVTGKVGTQTSGYTNNRNNSFTYDAAGNQTNDGLHNYTFNAENQITQMDGGAALYGYDGEGRRMKKTVGSETTYYFYGPGGKDRKSRQEAGLREFPLNGFKSALFVHVREASLRVEVGLWPASGTVIRPGNGHEVD